MFGPFLEAADGARTAIWREGDESGSTLSVGRTGENDLAIDQAPISRRHARLERRDGTCRLVDLGSRNGTFVNGERLEGGPRVLHDGDVIVLGGAVHLVFRDPMATPMAPRIGRLSGVWVDPESDAVWVDAARIEPPLSARQLALLQLLDAHIGEVVSRATIVDTVWADVAAEGVSDDAVSALVKRLRTRLRESPAGGEYVEVVKGRGVRLHEG